MDAGPFCSAAHRQVFKDRRRYWPDPDGEREKSRRYYEPNREKVLAKARARADAKRAERGEAVPTRCSECDAELPRGERGRLRVVCSPRCQSARYRRLNPEAYAAQEAAKVSRRREKRRAAKDET